MPADAFYEWKAIAGGMQPYAITHRDGAPLAFADLWKGWRSPEGEMLRTYTILTTTANATRQPLHVYLCARHRRFNFRAPPDWAVELVPEPR